MKIIGVEGLTNEQVNDEVGRGGRFVMYQYCISVLVMTFKRPSSAGMIALAAGLLTATAAYA